MKEKVLTVVIPSYNVEKYLTETLESFVNCKNKEKIDIIVVNDGSRDGTLKLAENYEENYKNFIKVINKENGGHGSTINSGLKEAKGKYFIVVDGDDWIDSTIMDEFIDFLQDKKEDVIVTGHYRNYINTGKEEYYTYSESKGFSCNLDYILKKNYLIPMTDICYKTSLLHKINLRIQEHTFYVDEEFCTLPFIEATSFCFFGQGFYHYRIGDINQSISVKNTIQRIEDKKKVLKNIYTLTLDKCYDENNKEYIERKMSGIANSILLINYVYISNKKEGYNKGKLFYHEIKNKYPLILERCKKNNRRFLVMNRMLVNEQMWRSYQQLKYKIKRK